MSLINVQFYKMLSISTSFMKCHHSSDYDLEISLLSAIE